jgi:hypothetical protein
MDENFRRFVTSRAGNCCEYCRLPQEFYEIRFPIDRILAGQHGGNYEFENVALACHRCNRKKGPNLAGIDPQTGMLTPLYNPRAQRWDEHFARDGHRIVVTPTGRTTVFVLDLNAVDRVKTRADLGGAG